ncbi:MAG: TauD/TfdA family dioxygenase [Alphaproteobacteria bacterium]
MDGATLTSDTLRPLTSPQAWYGNDMAAQSGDWRHDWSETEIAEILTAVEAVDQRNLDILDIDAEAFPLPTVAARLHEMREVLLDGPGLFLLRGLPIDGLSIRQAAIAFWGIGAHLGRPCSQNGKGHVLGHVKNIGLDYDHPMARGYQTSARLPYHTDSSDIVGLLCWQPSKSGGLSSIVSSTTVFNEALKRRPDLMETLTQPFFRTRWGEIPEGKKPWAEVPVFMPHEGRMISHYVRSAIRKGQLLPGAPKLTALQEEALDLVDGIANEPGIHLEMDFQQGDMQFVCNHSIWHSRTAFEDHAEPDHRRHLLRLWLACADGPPLPHWMTASYEGATEDGRPNGIQVPGVPLVAPLEAE